MRATEFTTARQRYFELYRETILADDEFDKAVIKQFGRHQSGDKRYRSSEHNEETRAAGLKYWNIANELLKAKKDAGL